MLRQLENSRHTVTEVRWSLKTADLGLHLERYSSAGSSCCLSQHHFTHPIMLADCKKVRFLQQWRLFLLHNLKYHTPSSVCTCQGECDKKVSKWCSAACRRCIMAWAMSVRDWEAIYILTNKSGPCWSALEFVFAYVCTLRSTGIRVQHHRRVRV